MIVNQRPYQFMLSRTGSPAAAFVVEVIAKTVGYLVAFAGELFSRGEKTQKNISELYRFAEEVFPKPKFSLKAPSALPKQDDSYDLSVVVPVHNTQKYIEACIESVLNQKTDFCIQLVLVDDGSTDSTPDILKKYSEYSNVICITHGTGTNAATARNTGIQYAVGEYIMFLDSDDILTCNAVEDLMQAARKSNSDIVQGSWRYLDEEGNQGHSQIYADHIYMGKTRCHVNDLPGMPWGKVYRRSLFDKIRFPYSYSCFEDAIIHFLIFPSAEKISSISQIVYEWRRNPHGITATSQNKPLAMQAFWIVSDLIYSYEQLELPHDELYAQNLAIQLSNYCYACVRGMDESIKKTIFFLCSDLYRQNMGSIKNFRMPYAVKLAHRALINQNYKLWELQGKLFQLIK